MYGGSLLETLDANAIIKSALPAGVSLRKITFHRFYNLFKNNAFISYPTSIPGKHNFELSMVITPDIIPSDGFVLFSQNSTFASEFTPVSCYYHPNDGIVFTTAPDFYTDNDIGVTYYTDGHDLHYTDSDSSVFLAGGTLTVNDDTSLRITRVGDTWSMYVNGTLVDETIVSHNFISGVDTNFYLGTSENKFYNSGSIYNLFLTDTTTNKNLINDALKNNTTGINNGVRFL